MKTLQATKIYFASIALPEFILSLSDMLTDFTNEIEHFYWYYFRCFQWVFWPVCNMPSVCRWSTSLSPNKNLLQTIQYQMEVSPPVAPDLFPPVE